MLVFASKIPVKKEMTEKDFVCLCSEWVYNSPHYHKLQINYDVTNHDDFECKKENITCQIACYKDDVAEIVAFRLKNIDVDKLWTLDLLFICENGNKFISVQNNLDSKSYNPNFPKNNKPNFIKQLIEKDYGLKESFFKVSDCALVCDWKNIEICAEFIKGKVHNDLPMVYISKNFNKYNIDYKLLSIWLSGMAYVVVESNKDISLKLKELTNSRNAHNGYVGIYYPGSNNYQLYSSSEFDQGKFEKNISLIVQQSLINRMPSSEYNWNQIQTLKARAKVKASENINKQELDEFMEWADNNERELKEKIALLQRNNDALTAQLEVIKMKNQDGYIRLNTSLQDFYINEQYDFVVNVLNEVKNHIGELDIRSIRRHEILNSIIENNSQTRECDRILRELESIFKGKTWNDSAKNKIRSLGFTVKENGHDKIIFHDEKYMYTVSCTPGESRGVKNLLSEIVNGISITKKLL